MKTDWKDDVFDGDLRKYKIIDNGDDTVSFQDVTEYSQQGDLFGAKEMNEIGLEIEETKKSVSDGKALVAAAITLKKIATAATDTFAQMAENISKIVLGSGNATVADVLADKTFTNDDGVEYTGTMEDKSGTTQEAAASLDTTNSRLQMTIPAIGKYSTASKLYATYSTIRTLIGLTADMLWPGNTVLGLASSNSSMAGGTYAPTTAQQTIACKGKAMTSDIVIGAMPVAAWTGWKQICCLKAQAVNYSGAEVLNEYDIEADLTQYNTFIFRVVYGTNSSTSTPSKLYQDTFIASRKANDTSSHTLTPTTTRNAGTEVTVSDVIYSVDVDMDCDVVEVGIAYYGESVTTTKYGWFEVVLIAALTL